LFTVTSKTGCTTFVRSSLSDMPESLADWRPMDTVAGDASTGMGPLT
jgi:hypothetical protein